MNARRGQLAEHATANLEWIWTDRPSDRNNFVAWLRGDGPVYWVTGKPGSGKSTLMKYVSEHQHTTSYLISSTPAQWLILQFFFDYRAAHATPNNLEGLVRSILFQLAKVNTAVEQCLEKDAQGNDLDLLHHDLDMNELRRLFSLAVSVISRTHYLCAFIDGLDEYAGRTLDVVHMIDFMIKNRIQKVCVASRPEHIPIQVFSHRPHLRMQDRNMSTIRDLVTHGFDGVKTFAENIDLQRLAESVIMESDGVILWSYLVVSHLVDGIYAGDTSEELHARLSVFPKELNSAYERLLNGVHTEYQSETAFILQLIQLASATGQDTSLWALRGSLSYLRYLQILPHWPEGCLRLDRFLIRLRSRSGSMVELWSALDTVKDSLLLNSHNSPENETDDLFRSHAIKARLFHKTLDTYLNQSGWLSDIMSSKCTRFDPKTLWLDMCVKCILEHPLSEEEVKHIVLSNTGLKPVGINPAHLEGEPSNVVFHGRSGHRLGDTPFLDCALGLIFHYFKCKYEDSPSATSEIDVFGSFAMQIHRYRDFQRGFEGPFLSCCCRPRYVHFDLECLDSYEVRGFTAQERTFLFFVAHKMQELASEFFPDQLSPHFARKAFSLLTRQNVTTDLDYYGPYISRMSPLIRDADLLGLYDDGYPYRGMETMVKIIPHLDGMPRGQDAHILSDHLHCYNDLSVIYKNGYNLLFVWGLSIVKPLYSGADVETLWSDSNSKDARTVLHWLVDRGLDVNRPCSCYGPLLHTLIELLETTSKSIGLEDLLRYLVDFGVDIQIRGPGGTALDIAERRLREPYIYKQNLNVVVQFLKSVKTS